jgi:hypothetical protein
LSDDLRYEERISSDRTEAPRRYARRSAVDGGARVAKLMDEIRYDLQFLKSHTLQPKWWKVAKVFVLLGFLAGHYVVFGLARTAVFLAFFLLLMGAVHLIYRAKTARYTKSWLDFVVTREGNEVKTQSIGKYYYLAIVINTMTSLLISHALV